MSSRHHFLATLIIDLVASIIVVICLIAGIVSTQQDDEQVTVICVLAIVVAIQSLIQFCGWKGYKDGSINLVRIYYVIRIIALVLSILRLTATVMAKMADADSASIAAAPIGLIVSIYMAWSSSKFLDTLKEQRRVGLQRGTIWIMSQQLMKLNQ